MTTSKLGIQPGLASGRRVIKVPLGQPAYNFAFASRRAPAYASHPEYSDLVSGEIGKTVFRTSSTSWWTAKICGSFTDPIDSQPQPIAQHRSCLRLLALPTTEFPAFT